MTLRLGRFAGNRSARQTRQRPAAGVCSPDCASDEAVGAVCLRARRSGSIRLRRVPASRRRSAGLAMLALRRGGGLRAGPAARPRSSPARFRRRGNGVRHRPSQSTASSVTTAGAATGASGAGSSATVSPVTGASGGVTEVSLTPAARLARPATRSRAAGDSAAGAASARRTTRRRRGCRSGRDRRCPPRRRLSRLDGAAAASAAAPGGSRASAGSRRNPRLTRRSARSWC